MRASHQQVAPRLRYSDTSERFYPDPALGGRRISCGPILFTASWEMLQTQSSLAESVDGEELRVEEGILEGNGDLRPSSTAFHSLYIYLPGGDSQPGTDTEDGSSASLSGDAACTDDFSLSLVDTNLPSESELELRSFVSKRLSRGALFEGMGNVASVELSSTEYSMGCFYCLLQEDKVGEAAEAELSAPPPEYIVCFLAGSEKGLDLFRLELDKYAEALKAKLDPQMSNLETDIRPHLCSWFEASVQPIQRVVHLFQEKLAYLLHAALSYTPVEVRNADDRTQGDISRFLGMAGLQGLVQEGTMASLCVAMTEEEQRALIVDCSDSQPQILHAGNPGYEQPEAADPTGRDEPLRLVSVLRLPAELRQWRHSAEDCEGGARGDAGGQQCPEGPGGVYPGGWIFRSQLLSCLYGSVSSHWAHSSLALTTMGSALSST
ncbi:hypothetical protein XENTR_v10004574 [Xenopus tropicalis]|nr:hypothetical protein XENTR_v10004574 [Xenopus tropicalis]